MEGYGFRVAILGFGRDFSHQHRIRNEIESLGLRYLVDGYGDLGVEGLQNFHVVRRPQRTLYRLFKLAGGVFPSLRIGFEQFHYRRLAAQIQRAGYRFLIPHDLDDALVAMMSGLPFIFHSHEFLPRQFDGSLLFRLTEVRYRRKVLARLLKKALAVVVEGDTVARQYALEFHVPRERFLVMPSMPGYRKGFAGSLFRSDVFNLVHHGALVPERGIELLMDIAAELGPAYHLTLMGPGPEVYLDGLRKRAASQGNITILPPVAYHDIVEVIHGADLGLVVFGSPHFHHQYMTVPNKFWESLQARIPVLVSPESAMAGYVRESGCGVVAEERTMSSYVEAIRSLTPEKVSSLKQRCEEKAWEHSRDSWLVAHADRTCRVVDNWYGVLPGNAGLPDAERSK